MDAYRLGDIGRQYFDDSGKPLAGGKMYFYTSGTATLATTYSDEALTTANANPVILDASGRQPSIFYDGDLKVVLRDADDVLVETRDPVGCCAATASGTDELPVGGTTGQALVKSSATDGDVGWSTISEVPDGGTTGQVLAKVSATDQDLEWADASSGGLWAFDTTVKTANFNATAGTYYFTDTTSANVAITLPSSPSAGDVVGVRQVAGANSTFINGVQDIESLPPVSWEFFPVLPVASGSEPTDEQPYVGLVYINATLGWTVFMGAIGKSEIVG